MAKKDFTKNNPVNRFITQPTEQIIGQQSISDEEYKVYQPGNQNEEKEVTKPKTKEIKRGRPKSKKEIKERKSIHMLPSLYEAVGKIAYINKISTAEQISNCLEKFVEDNEEKIKKYDELFK